MVRSMTGYGKAIADTGVKKLTVEIKSLNSKQLDINTKLPWMYKEKEIEIRNLISQRVGRGKVDLSVSYDMIDEETVPVINKTTVKNYFRQLQEVNSELGIESDNINLLQIVMRLPETVRSERPELSPDEWDILRQLIIDAVSMLDIYRAEEGKALELDMRNSAAKIVKYLDEIVPFEENRIVKIRERLESMLNEHKISASVDRNRFEQEMIYYLEKIDINEEKVRLRKHCEYFLETLSVDDANGKALSFIVQELGREINTIGSKANDASIQKLVVMMKEELEKIKEQALNVL
jgi:uncharacterized protein (TIGR00255 family)